MSINIFNFDVSIDNIDKLVLLYKVVLLKKIKIKNSSEYAEKLIKLENKIVGIDSIKCSYFKKTKIRNLMILHNILYSYIFRLKARGVTRVWQEAFMEYCLMNLSKEQITDINSVAHNIQNKIEILFEETLVKLDLKSKEN